MNKKDYFWNILGSTIYGVSGIILIIIINLISGSEISGRFSIAYVTAQMFMYVGNYGVRVYQASDIDEKYRFEDYYSNRIITCLIMIGISILFTIIRGYDFSMGLLIVITCAYKSIDAFADVFEGRLQQKNLFYLSGKSIFFRTVISSSTLLFILYIFNNLLIATFAAFFVSIFLIVIFSIYPSIKYTKIRLHFILRNLKNMMIECFPLFAAMFMLSYIINTPKYAIENTLEYDFQTYFNALYFPAQIIYLITSFIFKPLLNSMATNWSRLDTRYKVKKLVNKILYLIITLTMFTAFIAAYIGIPILNYIFNTKLDEYKSLMIFMLFGGGLVAIINMLYNTLTIMRFQKYIFISYSITFILALFIPNIFVEKYLLGGAVFSYDAILAVLAFMMVSFYCYGKRKND